MFHFSIYADEENVRFLITYLYLGKKYFDFKEALLEFIPVHIRLPIGNSAGSLWANRSFDGQSRIFALNSMKGRKKECGEDHNFRR